MQHYTILLEVLYTFFKTVHEYCNVYLGTVFCPIYIHCDFIAVNAVFACLKPGSILRGGGGVMTAETLRPAAIEEKESLPASNVHTIHPICPK